MNMKLIILFGLLYAVSAPAQDTGSVAVHRDPRVDSLINVQIRINDVTTRESRRTQNGYRIQVASSSDRNKIFSVKTMVYQKYPELQPYIIYQPPNYKLNVGNFKTPEEAQPYMDKLTHDFSSGVYLVPDIIEVKPE